MPDQNAKGKAKYESPVLVPLGEMAKGSGACESGSSVQPVDCSPGSADTASDCNCGGVPHGGAVTDCAPGYTDTRDCTEGVTANRNCTAGTCAQVACSAGTAATSACDAGTANVGG